jgi:hypothetical protein
VDPLRTAPLLRAALAAACALAAGLPAAAPSRADGGADAPPRPALLVEPLSEEWRERLLGPLLARLSPMGARDVAEAGPAEALGRVAAGPDSLAVLRRSRLADLPEAAASVEQLELGPAACLALVARAGTPQRSYAELNYADGGRPLRVVFASANARELFGRVRARFPLGGSLEEEERPAVIGLQRLGTGEADLLVLDVPRRSRSGVPAEKLAAALAKGHRLLALPAALPAPGMGLLPGDVQLDDPPFWRAAETYDTFCDPFVLAVRRDAADRLVHRLYTPVAAPSPDGGGGGGGSFLDQMLKAARGLGTIIAASLPL